jgi:hypothetical protein
MEVGQKKMKMELGCSLASHQSFAQTFDPRPGVDDDDLAF